MKKQIGWFSISAKGDYCFHNDLNLDPVRIAANLNESVTGGPYTVVKAYIKVKKNESNDYLSR
jgi:cephalosporin hydroxylase